MCALLYHIFQHLTNHPQWLSYLLCIRIFNCTWNYTAINSNDWLIRWVYSEWILFHACIFLIQQTLMTAFSGLAFWHQRELEFCSPASPFGIAQSPMLHCFAIKNTSCCWYSHDRTYANHLLSVSFLANSTWHLYLLSQPHDITICCSSLHLPWTPSTQLFCYTLSPVWTESQEIT